jgi:hypothetical protein
MPATLRALMIAPILAAVCGCAAQTPLALNAPSGEVVTGSLPATVYTGLSESPGDGKACRGSYTGAPASSVVLLEVQCGEGGRGIGTGLMDAGKLVGGSVRMQDGRQATVRIEERPAR